MDLYKLEKLEKLADLVLIDLYGINRNTSIFYYKDLKAKVKNLFQIAFKTLPEHKDLFLEPYNSLDDSVAFKVSHAISIIGHLLKIIKIEKASLEKSKELKIFESAEEKMKAAGLTFEKGDFSSTFHCLNTAFELVLKDKIGIPTTITGINTSNIVEVLVKHKVEPYLYFKEVKKRVTEIDNKIKHQGYSPSKIDAINGIKAMEDLISKLRGKELDLSEEVKNKICEGL